MHLFRKAEMVAIRGIRRYLCMDNGIYMYQKMEGVISEYNDRSGDNLCTMRRLGRIYPLAWVVSGLRYTDCFFMRIAWTFHNEQNTQATHERLCIFDRNLRCFRTCSAYLVADRCDWNSYSVSYMRCTKYYVIHNAYPV